MTRAWIAVALLAGSWLLGRDYLGPAHPVAWVVVLLVAVFLLSRLPIRWPDRRRQRIALLLALPAIWLIPLPGKVVPLLLCAGLFLQLAPLPRRWPRDMGDGALVAGTILLVQALIFIAYELLTARSHGLPPPLAQVVGSAARLVGIDTAVEGSSVVVRSVQDQLRFAATWELLFDPATVCFVGGSLVLLALLRRSWRTPPADDREWHRCVPRLLLVTAIWALLRVVLLLAVIVHRTLRADPIALPNVSDVLVNSWLHVIFVVILGVVSARVLSGLVALPSADDDHPSPGRYRQTTTHPITSPIFVATGICVLTFLFLWNPVGQRRAGRVTVVERHSTWEPTTEPYGTEVYGEAGSYNYAAAYAYCEQYYEMSRLLEDESISDSALADCDVLVIKTPTAPYSPGEIDAVVRFVENGGSLLLIGDHTNVFNMNTYLNDIARHFGFTFRNDLLFHIEDPYRQAYQPPQVAHPIVQHVPPMHFAVSCSIDPGWSLGRMVIRSTGLWSLPPAYHESNYHPQAEYAPEMQYGAWCQLWATTAGSGRVVAFADSTLFSNFCVFQPGKAELLRGMLEWLNHTSPLDRRAPKLLLVIPATLVAGLLVALGAGYVGLGDGSWLIVLAAALAGWSAAALAVSGVHRSRMPVPPKPRPMPHVIIDRTLSAVSLHTGAFADAEDGSGYGMLEQWIPRIGNFTSRRRGDDVFLGDGLVVICPTRSVDRDYQNRLVQYVQGGGHVLVFDSPDVEGSTANSLLWPFGLASSHDTEPSEEGTLQWSHASGTTPLRASCEITGGETLAVWGTIPVAARARHGEGTITAIGFGSLFNDESMGTHWLAEPEPEVRRRYEILYAILHASLEKGSPGPSSRPQRVNQAEILGP